MPIYEYQCDACKGTFETIRKFSDPPLSECRLCGAEGVRKLLSAPAFRLKGGGWYETDFKNANQRNLVKGDSESGGRTDGTAGAKTDSGSADAASGKADSGKADSGKAGSGSDGSAKKSDAASSTGSSATSTPAQAKPAST